MITIRCTALKWKLNGVDVGINSNTYTSSTLNNGDQISCELISNENCVSGNPVVSNVITMIVSMMPTVANAGPDINPACGVTTATLAANTPTVGTGVWSVVSGTATITNPSSPTSGVTGLAISGTPGQTLTATLRWTISNSPCAHSYDEVVVTTTSCFICGSNVTFAYNGSTATYGTVNGDYNAGQYCWLDRNLGATEVATAVSHIAGYGDLFQWGRLDDGHQVRSSIITSNQSSLTNPGHNNFITSSNWYSGSNPDNLWQGVSYINNPCPAGWRLPTDTELENERQSWTGGINSTGAIQSALKLPAASIRWFNDGSFSNGRGYYWSSTVINTSARLLTFSNSSAYINYGDRGNGMSVRCLRD